MQGVNLRQEPVMLVLLQLLLVAAVWAPPSLGSVNLVMPSGQVSQLLGIQSSGKGRGWELAYVRDGVVNANAAAFVVPVPETVNALTVGAPCLNLAPRTSQSVKLTSVDKSGFFLR